MSEINLKGRIVNGKLELSKSHMVSRLLSQYNDHQVEITIKPYEKSISNSQRRWYKGVALPYIKRKLKSMTGDIHSTDAIHKMNIDNIFKPRIISKEIHGKTIVEIYDFSMENMSREEFDKLKTETQKYWSEKGIDIPDPNETNFDNDYFLDEYKRKFK